MGMGAKQMSRLKLKRVRMKKKRKSQLSKELS
jgi:hypothetical protein